MPRIQFSSIYVDDQQKGLDFYTDVLGFIVKNDIPMGQYRWITLVSADDPNGPELVLEPAAHPAVPPYRAALVADGIPMTAFAVEDVQASYERLVAAGARFVQEPVEMGPVTTAVLDDTCGNLIQIVG
ncbi:VOC family protein [Cellulomonas sp. NPDC055163]